MILMPLRSRNAALGADRVDHRICCAFGSALDEAEANLSRTAEFDHTIVRRGE